MNLRCYIILLIAVVPSLHFAKEVAGVKALTADQIGEFVTVMGSAAGYSAPAEDRAPHSFRVRDLQGDVIRVVSWPDIFENVENRHLLDDPRASVTLTGEVTEYRGRLELQLHDWEEIKITTQTMRASGGKHASAGALHRDDSTTGAVAGEAGLVVDGALDSSVETTVSQRE